MILKSHHAENSRGKSKLILITFSRSISASDYLCCVPVLQCQPLKATCLHLKTHTDIRKMELDEQQAHVLYGKFFIGVIS